MQAAESQRAKKNKVDNWQGSMLNPDIFIVSIRFEEWHDCKKKVALSYKAVYFREISIVKSHVKPFIILRR